MNPTIKFYILSIITIILTVLTIVSSCFVLAAPTQNSPKGPLEIGLGPTPEATRNMTEVTIDISAQTIDVLVTFRFNETEKYFIYVLLPYQALSVSAYAVYEGGLFPSLPLAGKPDVGNWSTNLFFNNTLGSSIVNASLDVNPNFPWHFGYPDMKDGVAIGVSIRVHESLMAISDRFGARQTVIFTFFGQSIGIMSQEMYAYKYPQSQLTIGYPFIVSLRIPSSCYYSDSQPSPIEYYVRQDERWAMFSLDFLGGRYAQTLLCNFVNPVGQSSREIWIFLIGVFSALSISFGVEAASRYTEKAGTEQKQKAASEMPVPSNQQPPPVDTKKLIDLVDAKFEKRPRLQYLLSVGLVISYALAVGIIGYLLSLISLNLAHVQAESLIPSYVGLVAALISFVALGINIPRILPPEERLDLLVNHNFRKIEKEKDVNEWEKPVLKALIKMKSKNPEFNLKDIPNKKLFDENRLLERLYQ